VERGEKKRRFGEVSTPKQPSGQISRNYLILYGVLRKRGEERDCLRGRQQAMLGFEKGRKRCDHKREREGAKADKRGTFRGAFGKNPQHEKKGIRTCPGTALTSAEGKPEGAFRLQRESEDMRLKEGNSGKESEQQQLY